MHQAQSARRDEAPEHERTATDPGPERPGKAEQPWQQRTEEHGDGPTHLHGEAAQGLAIRHGDRGDFGGHQSSSNSFFQDSSFGRSGCARLSSRKFSTTRKSISVRMKQRYASDGLHTIGSPRTLNDVLTSTPQPVRRSNSVSNAWKRGLVSRCTDCTRAE